MSAQQQARIYLDLVSNSDDADPHTFTRKYTALQGFLDVVSGAGMGRLTSMEVQMRRGLAQALLNDLEKMASTPQMGEGSSDHRESKLLTLRCLKELSRLPGGSNVQSEPTGMRTLLKHVSLPTPLVSQPLHTHRHQRHPSLDASDASSVNSDTSATSGLSAALQRIWKRGPTGGHSNKTSMSTHAAEGAADANGMQVTCPDDDPSSSSRFVDWTVTDTALRCLNNALVLHETSRKAFAEDRVGGARKVIGLLRNPSQTPADIIFLASRLLFFSTLFDATFNKVAVEEEHLVDHLVSCIYDLTAALQHPRSNSSSSFQSSSSLSASDVPAGSVPQVKTALAEILKVVFNLGLYYPRVTEDLPTGAGRSMPEDTSTAEKGPAIVGEAFNDRLAILLDPVIQVLFALPSDSLTPPSTNAIGVLLNFPVKPYRASWLQDPSLAQYRRASAGSSTSTGSSTTKLGRHTSSSPSGHSTIKRLGSSVFHSRGSGGAPSSHSTLHPVLESTTQVNKDDPHTSHFSSSSCSETLESSIPLIDHLLSLLESFTSRYFPPNALSAPGELDSDDRSTHLLAQQDGDVQLEEVGQPIQLLLRKLCIADGEMRRAIKRRILPDDIDRTIGLDRRSDLTGRLVRLLSSVTYSRLGRVAGELLLAICNEDPRELVSQIGYGPCAGFLVSNGFGDSFPPGSTQPEAASKVKKDENGNPAKISEIDDDDEGVGRPAIDPITGTYIVPLAPATSVNTTKKEESTAIPRPPTSGPSGKNASAAAEVEMTEEEKEVEAERLFGLFDRMDRTGVMKMGNPFEQPGVQEKIRLSEEKETKKMKEQELREEQEALKELAKWKARKTAR